MCLCATTVALAAGWKTLWYQWLSTVTEEISTAECNIHVQGAIADADVSTIRAYIVSHGYTTVDVTTIPATNRYKLTSTDIVKLFGNYQVWHIMYDTSNDHRAQHERCRHYERRILWRLWHCPSCEPDNIDLFKDGGGSYFSWGNSNIEKKSLYLR